MGKATIQIQVDVKNEMEAAIKANALQTIAQNINHDNLILLAEKSKTMGINIKIQTFKNLI